MAVFPFATAATAALEGQKKGLTPRYAHTQRATTQLDVNKHTPAPIYPHLIAAMQSRLRPSIPKR